MDTNKILNYDDSSHLSLDVRKSQIEKHNLEIRDHSFLNVPCLHQLGVASCPSGEGPAPCRSSMSSLTGLTALSLGSRVQRPCQILRSNRTGFSSRRATPSLLLQHGFDWISDEDQKILTIMVARREAQMEAADLSVSARNLWEKDRIAYNQHINEKQKQWGEYLQQKRRIEKEELERRKENISELIKYERAELEGRIKERHARCERRYDEILHKKRLTVGDVDTDDIFHRLRREQINQDEELRSTLHVNVIAAKEKQADENLKAIARQKERLIQERSYKREKRMAAAQLLREALKERFDEYCELNMKLLNDKLQLCEYRALKNVEARRKMAHDKNYMKRLNHFTTQAALKEEERAKELMLRQGLLINENKAKNHVEKKEQAKARSRINALTTAQLRNKIRDSFQLIT